MLELVEPFVDLTRRIRTRQDALSALERTCETFGFRAAVMLEYAPGLTSVVDYLDTNETRRPRWKKPTMNADDKRRSGEMSRLLIEGGKVVRFEPSRFALDDPYRQIVAQLDLLEGMSVPITHRSGVAGAIHFSGLPALSETQEAALHVICFMLFANFRAVQGKDDDIPLAALTPREKEVMIQSSLGYTSPEIASMLGLAERTVNQHIENVSSKFGTKNRLHTVANLIRLNLLD